LRHQGLKFRNFRHLLLQLLGLQPTQGFLLLHITDLGDG
jgi:hypothetical protein